MTDNNYELLIYKYNELNDYLINNNNKLNGIQIIKLTEFLKKTKSFINQCDVFNKYVNDHSNLLINQFDNFLSKL